MWTWVMYRHKAYRVKAYNIEYMIIIIIVIGIAVKVNKAIQCDLHK